MSAELIAAAIYSIGWLAALVAFGHVMQRQSGALDGGDVGFVVFAAFGWPILVPFVAFVWAVRTLLPLFGVEVKR